MRTRICITLIVAFVLPIFMNIAPNHSFASSYALTVETTGTGFPTGGSLSLSNGDILVLSQDRKMHRFNSKLESKPIQFDSANESSITEIGNNRLFTLESNRTYHIRELDGTEITTGNLTEIDPTLIDFQSIASFQNSGKILLSSGSTVYLLDSNMQLLGKTELKENINGQEVRIKLSANPSKYKGEILAYVYPDQSGGEKSLRIYRFSDDLTYKSYVYPGAWVPDQYSSMMELNNGSIFFSSYSQSVLVDANFNLKEVIPHTGRYSYNRIVQEKSFSLGDGTVFTVGLNDSSQVGFQIINEDGNEIYSQAAPDFYAARPIAKGRFFVIWRDGTYTVYVTPAGRIASNIPDLTVPNNLRVLSQSGDDVQIGWVFDELSEENRNLSHFEVFVNDSNVGPSMGKTFQTKLITPGQSRIQVVAVDSSLRRTDLSAPLYLTKSTDENSNGEVIANIQSGVISLSNSPVAFSDVPINNKETMVSTGTTSLTINDSRGTGAGWSVQLSATDFESSPISNPSGSGTFRVRIPVQNLTFNTNGPELIAGQTIDGSKMIYSETGTLTNTGQSLINATAGAGMGIYNLGVTFTMSVPQKVSVFNLTDEANSKFSNGDLVGIYAGTYTSTFTFTTGVGL